MEIQSAFENTHINMVFMSIEKGPFLNCHGNKVNVRILRRRLHFLDPYGPYINNTPENDNGEKMAIFQNNT